MDPNYLKKFFDNKEYSDLIMEDNDQNIVYLHSFIIRQHEYFNTWFNSSISDKTKIHVSDIQIAKKLIAFMYGFEFVIEPDMDYDEFFELVDLSQMWLLPQRIKDIEFAFVVQNYESMIKKDINYSIPLYTYFEKQPSINGERHPTIAFLTKQYNGKWLVENITKYVSSNILNLNGGFINLPVAKFVPNERYIMACIEYKYYDKLIDHMNALSSDIYMNAMNKYINDNIQKIVPSIFESTIAKYLDFENYTILSLKYELYDLIDKFTGFKDDRTFKRINNYITRTFDKYDKRLLDSNIVKYLDPQLLINMYIKYGDFNKLLNIPTQHIKEAFKEHYHTNVFTNAQLNAIMTADAIIPYSNQLNKSAWKTLRVKSFVPFIGSFYIITGQCKKINDNTIVLRIRKSISKQDKISINDIEYSMKSIKSQDDTEINNIVKPSLDHIEYTIKLDKNIDNINDNKSYFVYKIRDL